MRAMRVRIGICPQVRAFTREPCPIALHAAALAACEERAHWKEVGACSQPKWPGDIEAAEGNDVLTRGTGFAPLPVTLQSKLAARFAAVKPADGKLPAYLGVSAGPVSEPSALGVGPGVRALSPSGAASHRRAPATPAAAPRSGS